MLKKHDIVNRHKKTTTINSILGSRDVLSNGESNENNNKDRAQATYNKDKDVINNYYRNLKKYEKPGIFGKFILEYKVLFIILCFFVFVFLGFLIAVIILAVKYKYAKNNKCVDCFSPSKDQTCPICPNNIIEGIGGSIKIELVKGKNNFELMSPYYLFDSSTSNQVYIAYSNKNISIEDWDGYIEDKDIESADTFTVYFKNITKSGYRMFYNNDNIKAIDFTNFNLSFLTNTEQMFYNMTNLETITGLEKINTNNAVSMQQMFYNCQNLNFPDSYEINVKSAASTKEMFHNCQKLKNVVLSSQNASKLIDMDNMFAFSSIENFNMHNFIAEKLVTMNGMFLNCSNLNNVVISSLNAPKLRKIDDIFKNSNTSYVVMSDWSKIKIGEKVSLNYIFKDCPNLIKVDFNNYRSEGDFTFSNFLSDSKLEIFNFKNNYIGGSLLADRSFIYCSELKSLEFSNIEINNDFNFESFLNTAEEIIFSNISVKKDVKGDFRGEKEIKTVVFRNNIFSNDADFSYMFSGRTNVSYVTFDNIFVGNNFEMKEMLHSLTNGIKHEFLNIKVKGDTMMNSLYNKIEMDTLNIINISIAGTFKMTQFLSGEKISRIIFNGFNIQKTSEISTISGAEIRDVVLSDSIFVGEAIFTKIFTPCQITNFSATNLTFLDNLKMTFQSTDFLYFKMNDIKIGKNLDFSNFFEDIKESGSGQRIEFSNIEANQNVSLTNMFSGIASKEVETIIFTSNNFRYVNMESMFEGLTGLPSVDFSGSIFNEISSLARMFYGCSKLTDLNLSMFYNVTDSDMKNMFSGCSKLSNLNIFYFKSNSELKTNGMFDGLDSNCHICIDDTESYVYKEAIKVPTYIVDNACQINTPAL